MALDEVLAAHFEDPDAGGFFLTSDDHEALLVREKPAQDGAEPCGNSVQLLNLYRLAELTSNDQYRQRAERAVTAFSSILAKWPSALSEMLLPMEFRRARVREVVLVTPGPHAYEQSRPFLDKLHKALVPNKVVIAVQQGERPSKPLPGSCRWLPARSLGKKR